MHMRYSGVKVGSTSALLKVDYGGNNLKWSLPFHTKGICICNTIRHLRKLGVYLGLHLELRLQLTKNQGVISKLKTK